MNKENIQSRIIKIMKTALKISDDISEITETYLREEQHVTSLDFIYILVNIEDEFNIIIDDYSDILDNIFDINKLTEYIYQKQLNSINPQMHSWNAVNKYQI